MFSAVRAHVPRAALGVVLASSLVVAGCSGGADDGSKTSSGTATDTSTANPTTLSRRSPLTGLTMHGRPPRRPVLTVKVDNTENSRPQVGLSKADLVSEELVEGGSTRLAAFYYSHLPKVVGPVRSMRASDIGVVRPAHAAIVASGGAPPTNRRVAAAHITTYTEGATGYYRDSGRPAPYNLFMRLPALAAKLRSAKPSQAYLPWGKKNSLPSGRPAKAFSVRFSAGHTTRWQFGHGRYTRTNGLAASGDRFRPETVLALRVRIGDAGYLDPAGNPVPETKFTGTGKAMVFHDGRLVRGTWVKKGLNAPVRLRTHAGSLKLPAGHVFVELVPSQNGDVTLGG